MKEQEVTMVPYMLGSMILHFKLPMVVIDEINQAYDEQVKDLQPWNKNLVGKIEEENLVNSLITDDMKVLFTGCFQQYMISISKPWWNVSLQHVWINEMKAGEYNPFHTHASPDTYGKEITNPEDPSNGWLELTGGNQDPLGVPSWRRDLEPGDFIVFPYTMLHGVYPFNGTDEARRTLSYNCDLIRNQNVITNHYEKPEVE
jgi:hypothetical protein